MVNVINQEELKPYNGSSNDGPHNENLINEMTIEIAFAVSLVVSL